MKRILILGLACLCTLASFAGAIFATSTNKSQQALSYLDNSKLANVSWGKYAPKGARITDQGWFAQYKKKSKKVKPKSVENVFILPMREPIMLHTFEKFKKKVQLAREQNAKVIIIDMDTWGGQVAAALDIVRMIRHELKDIYVVCYIRTRAVSAGSMIALACDEIIMNDTGKLGDSAPIVPGRSLEKTEREKIEVVVREDFVESAMLNGYSTAIATKMVSTSRACWLIRNKKTYELKYVIDQNWLGKITIPYSFSDKKLAAKDYNSNPNSQWELIGIPYKKSDLVLLNPEQAKTLGFAASLIQQSQGSDKFAPIRKYLNAKQTTYISDSLLDKFADFLIQPFMTSVLSFIMLVCAYTELRMPGFGVFGLIAVVCFLILTCSHYIIGFANWWEIAMLFLGIILILLEIFVIPGFGVAGVLGILFFAVGLLAMMIPNMPGELPIPSTPWMWDVFKQGLISILAAFVLSTIACFYLSVKLPKLSILKRSSVILEDATALETSPRSDSSPIHKIKVGDTGETISMLRPVGTVRFGKYVLDAVSDSGFVSPNQKVKIISISENRILVEQVASNKDNLA